jgi:hypothetical protein
MNVLKIRLTYADGHQNVETIGPNNNESINKAIDRCNVECQLDMFNNNKMRRFEMWCEDEQVVH